MFSNPLSLQYHALNQIIQVQYNQWHEENQAPATPIGIPIHQYPANFRNVWDRLCDS